MQDLETVSADHETPAQDLGPLAWVLEELRKSLDGAVKAIRRFVRDAELARGSDLESLDASQLRIARQQLHQAVGALEMVGLAEPAKVLRSMETLAQRFVEHPEFCSDQAATKVERASFALVEYLESVLRGKTVSAVALFPQYRDILELNGEERIHPAELWHHTWRWIDAEMPLPESALSYEASVRVQLDSSVLRLVKSGSGTAAGKLRDLCLGLAAGQPPGQVRAFWKIAGACFEGLALKLAPADLYVKRAASRLLMQYTSLARGAADLSERLAQDLLFFCSQAVPASSEQAPALTAVRQAYGLGAERAVSYDKPQYGRFDPSVLVQARKRIATATETWSALSGGDTHRLKAVADQFTQVGESLLKLNPDNKELVRALIKAVDATVRTNEPPSTPVAMEVATAILYVDAAYDDLDPTDTHQKDRSERLAQRLDHVVAGGEPEALEPWMEELYRRVSDRQTMGSVVEELRSGLTAIEKSLDGFFRNPRDKTPLHDVPNQLAQMRGVFSVLGLDQASLATMRMRDAVEKFLVDDLDEGSARSGVFDKFGNSLGALGFLIDMLSYQRLLAKKLFVYDESIGELRPLMGREGQSVQAPGVSGAAAPQPVAPVPVVDESPAVAAASQTPAEDEDDTDLRQVFLEEAREVIDNGRQAIFALHQDAADLGQQTTLRRSFHTLKGSSRMVGFTEFGEAAWALEQMMNNWLAEQKPAPAELLHLSDDAMVELGRWVDEIAAGKDAGRSALPFRRSADAMRQEGRLLDLTLPSVPARDVPAVSAAAPVDFPPLPELPPLDLNLDPGSYDFSPTETFELPQELTPVASRTAAPQPVALDDVADIDFSSLASVSQPTAEPEPLPLDAAPTSMGDIEFNWDVPGSLPETPAEPSVPLDLESALEPEIDDAMPELPPLSPDSGSDLPATSEASAVATDAEEAATSFDWLDLPELAPEIPGANDAGATAPTTGSEVSADDEIGTAGEYLTPSDVRLDIQSELQPEIHVETLSAGTASEPERSDDQVKVIGDLRIGIPLYNVYLNEADEWSRRLATELGEWSLELHRPIPDTAIALAHSLAGSSGTVGFSALSGIARALEHAMQHVQLHGQNRPGYAATFVAAAENIRQLLHQFAAGFLKDPEPGLREALQAIIDTSFEAQDSFLPSGSTSADLSRHELEHEAVEDLDLDLDIDLDFTTPTSSAPLPGAAQIVASDSDEEEIDAIDVIDPDLFPIFDEEAAELIPHLGTALRRWVVQPGDSAARQEVLRSLHTLKGSARLAGAMRLGEMAHRMESAIEQMGSGDHLQPAQIEPMLARYDRLIQAMDGLRRGADASPADLASLVESEGDANPTPADVPAPPVASEEFRPQVTAAAPVIPMGALKAPATLVVSPARPTAQQSVRVRSSLLDRLVNQAGEVMITRTRLDARLNQLNGSLGELTANLDRLRTHLRDVELQAESQMQSRLAQAKDSAQGFDPLEFDRFTRVQELTRMMAESVNDVATVQRTLQQTVRGTEDDLIAQARQTRELQRDLLRTRMVEFEGISERLYGVVRQASKDAGKQVRLDIVGGTMEVDRGVLERMTPAFEHILRNAVAHGIESPSQREARGKSTSGAITIAVSQEGNDVSISFTDDGAGLDLERIREKAMAQGLIDPSQPIGDDEAAALIFLPGLSTASQVTELAGRGIGMDVVRTEIQSLGGRIETATAAGTGSRFKLVLPLTTAVTQVIMLRMGDLSIGVPANLVEIVRRLRDDELAQAYTQGALAYDNESVPFFWAGALLQSSARTHEHGGKSHAVVVLRSAGQRLAVHVDEVLGNQEVVVKNLGPQLSRLPGLAGMTVLASGAVVLIYNPVALASVYGEMAQALQHKGAAPAQPAAASLMPPGLGIAETIPAPLQGGELPLVLVVDDSITVRRVTQRLLRREGYRVALAADGLQALEQLAQERPSLVLTDIEMPRMDGFDLVRNIRADVHLRDLPVVMITSRIAQKHRDMAEKLGVNHYLGKPYSEDDLLALVKHYCEQAAASFH